MYTGNLGLPTHVFARKSVLHVFARRYVFWPKSHARTMIFPSFHVHGQRRVTDTRFCPKVRFTRLCPALRFLAKITCAYHVFAQFSCTRATSGVHGQRRVTDTRFCPKVRFTRFCPALRFLTKITCGYHLFAQFSCTRPTSGYRCT